MSKAEEIAKTIVKRGYSDITSDEEYDHWVNVVANDIDKHTNQTLQELKEKVGEKIGQAEEGIQNSPHGGKIKYACAWTKQELEDVIQLIDEAINE